MSVAFLHGIETTESINAGVTVTVVRSAVIGLIGAAPIFMEPGIEPPWNPGAHYAIGAQVLDSNMNVQQCIIAGTTGTSAPTWATTIGALTAADGAVTWRLISLANQASNGLGSLNQAILVNSSNDASYFGAQTQGYSIPYALSQIQEQGSGQIICVNVFNPALHNTAVAVTAYSLPTSGEPQVISLGHMGVLNVIVQNSGKTSTYVYNTDYTIDWVNGLLSVTESSAITVAELLSIAFDYCDPTQVTAEQIIGAVSAGVYTGLQCLLTTFNSMGFFAKVLIAPHFSNVQNVASAMDSLAQTIRAMSLADSVASTTVATAISNRDLPAQAFGLSSTRTVLCFPTQLVNDTGLIPTGVTVNSLGQALQANASTTADVPYSPFVAGAIAARDIANGYWWSPSNMTLAASLGPDIPLYTSFTDPNSDSNSLNAAGILTVLQAFGAGLRVWGNRSSAYPGTSTPDVFIPIRRTLDVIEESLQISSLPFADQPIDNGLIASILATGNAFIRTLIQRGALISGSTINYNVADNPSSQLQAGQIVFEIDCMPPPPAERITYNFVLTPSLLANIGPPQTSSSN